MLSYNILHIGTETLPLGEPAQLQDFLRSRGTKKGIGIQGDTCLWPIDLFYIISNKYREIQRSK